ncbi:MAG: right-handed parallel beta-helix repeat-containing protein [Xanthomonadaceae bacterium]|nr:right-handed parallel beta-helix repeat-containing protein [Xanthomonadaceae bacterium]
MLRKTLLCASLWLCLQTGAHAATHYIAVNGNDAAPGTIDAPVATFGRACQLARPGDTVRVRGGTYTRAFSLSCSGTASAPIKFAPQPGETVVIDGSGTAPDTTLVYFYGKHLDFSGFEIANGTRSCVGVWGGHGIRIAGNDIHHCQLGGIWVGHDNYGANTSITIEGNRVHETALRFRNTTQTSGWPSAVSVGNTIGGVVRGNRVWNNSGEGIGIGHGEYIDVLDNVTHDNFSTNIYLDHIRESVVARNFAYTTHNPLFFRYGAPANGISVANEFSRHQSVHSERIRIVNNVVSQARYGIYYGNFQMGTGMDDVLIAHNTVYDTVAEAIRLENAPFRNVTVLQNLVDSVPGRPVLHIGASGVLLRRNGWSGVTPWPSLPIQGDVFASSGLRARFAALPPSAMSDARNYAVTPGSVLAASGQTSPDVPTDFLGVKRDDAASLGAFEVVYVPARTH